MSKCTYEITATFRDKVPANTHQEAREYLKAIIEDWILEGRLRGDYYGDVELVSTEDLGCENYIASPPKVKILAVLKFAAELINNHREDFVIGDWADAYNPTLMTLIESLD